MEFSMRLKDLPQISHPVWLIVGIHCIDTKRKLLGLKITCVICASHISQLTFFFLQNLAKMMLMWLHLWTFIQVTTHAGQIKCTIPTMYVLFFWKDSLWIPGICFMNAQQIGSAWSKKDTRYWAVVPRSQLNSLADFQGYEKNSASAHTV